MPRILISLLLHGLLSLIFTGCALPSESPPGSEVKETSTGTADRMELPRRIYAHHMGSLQPGRSAMAWHRSNAHRLLGDPATSKGGEYRNFPLVPQEMRNLTREESADLEIRRAMRIGIDGFAVNAWAGDDDAKQFLHALFRVAEANNYNFEITICLDPLTTPDGEDTEFGPEFQAHVDSVRYLLDHHGDSPNLARRDGRPLIFGYHSVWIGVHYAVARSGLAWDDPELRATPEGWRLMGDGYRAFQEKVGEPLFLHYDISPGAFYHGVEWTGGRRPPHVSEPASIIGEYVDAIGCFLPWGDGEYMKQLAGAVKATSTEWSQPVYAQYDNGRTDIVHGGNGSETLRNLLQQAIETDSTLIQYTTWNDYVENTNLAPATNTRYALAELASHLILEWKEGAAVETDRDRVYVFSRKYPPGTPTYPFRSSVYREGVIEVTTLLTKPAEIQLKGRGESYPAPAGLYTKHFPVVPGKVKIEVSRNGIPSLVLEVPEPVSSRPFRQDNGLVGYSTECEDQWSIDFPNVASELSFSEYGDLDGDGLPNWFEMYWFGAFHDFSTATSADPETDINGSGRSNKEEYLLQKNPLESASK